MEAPGRLPRPAGRTVFRAAEQTHDWRVNSLPGTHELMGLIVGTTMESLGKDLNFWVLKENILGGKM